MRDDTIEYRVKVTGPKSARERFLHHMNKASQEADTEGLEISITEFRQYREDDYPGFKTAKEGSNE